MEIIFEILKLGLIINIDESSGMVTETTFFFRSPHSEK